MEIYLLSFWRRRAEEGRGEAIKQIGSPLFFPLLPLEAFFGVPLSPPLGGEEEERGTGVTQSRVQSLLPSEGKEEKNEGHNGFFGERVSFVAGCAD